MSEIVINMRKIFGIRLKELRESKSFLQKDLAEELGIKQNTLSNWELGNREPTFDQLCRLADIFNTTTDYLLGREPKKTMNI
jgi:transcriptional regulator with XRE-family HTH domain